MKLNIKKVIILLLAVILLGTTFALIKDKNKSTVENNDITYQKVTMITSLRLGIVEYDNFSPILTQNRDIIQINNLIYEPLLTVTEDYKIDMCLAKEWTKISGNSYVLKLNENVKWHDGESFTADDVKFTINEIKESKSIYLENVKYIEAVEVLDAYTIKIKLSKEIPFFEYNLTFPIISQRQYEAKNIIESKGIPYGTGKYKISKINEEKIELIKNKEYRNITTENANIETIIITKYQNMGEVYNAFKNGKIDLFQTTNQNVEEHIGSMGYQKQPFKGREYDYLAINCKNEVLKNKEVRQAFYYTINQEEITSSIFHGKAYSSYFPLDYGNYVIDNEYFKNITNDEIAKKTLKDAGWKYEYDTWTKEINGRKEKLSFTLTVNKNNEIRIKVAEKIKEQLEKIGIKVTIKTISENQYEKTLETKNYELLLTGVYNSISPDITTFLGENNLCNYENNEINTLLEEARNVRDEKTLKEKYNKIIEIYKQETPFISLYRNQSTIIYSQGLMGNMSPNNYNIFYNIVDWYRK